MAERFGQIESDLSIAASHAIRRNSADNAFETFDTSSLGGVAIGDAIGGSPTSNGVLRADSSGNLSNSSLLTFDGKTLITKSSGASQTEDIFNATRYDGAIGLRVEDDTTTTIGGSYDYANGKHATMHTFQYAGAGGYSVRGLKLSDIANGTAIRFHALGGSPNTLYLTDDAGSAAGLTLGIRGNPNDGSQFIAAYNLWYLPETTSTFSVATSNSTGQINSLSTSKSQFCGLYDASNYFTIQAGSTGAVTFNAVGSGAEFNFSDPVICDDYLEVTGNINALSGMESDGDVLINSGAGVILVSPDLTQYRLEVDNSGNVSASAV